MLTRSSHQSIDAGSETVQQRVAARDSPARGAADALGRQPGALTPGLLLALQRAAGNAAVGELLRQGPGTSPAARAPVDPAPPPLPAWRPSSELWYFEGEQHRDPLPTEATLTVQPQAEGSFEWAVVDGSDKVELAHGGSDARHAGTGHDGQVRVRSRIGSAGEDDVRIRVAETAGNGSLVGVYEGNLGVRTPAGTRRASAAAASPAAAAPGTFPVGGEESDQGGGGDGQAAGSQEEQAGDQSPSSSPEAPATAPRSLAHQPTSHKPHATFAYESRDSYEVLDDMGRPITGFDVNEKFTSITNDDPTCDWRHTEGGAHSTTTTFADVMQGETTGHHPAPQAPQTPLGTHKVQHMAQEWRIGSTTPGSGTLVQRNILQRYQDHAAHENIKSPP